MTFNEEYMYWRNHPFFDDDTRKQLDAVSDNIAEIKDRFEKDLEFGTGGLRGIVGAGTNRMNIYVVRKASQGLSDYLTGKSQGALSIVIGYDSRSQSELFALEAAKVFCGNSIMVYLFGSPRPTPMLSFAIRQLHAAAGVMITASHNPKEYNGYKIYTEDGAQLCDTEEVSKAISAVEDLTQIRVLDSENAAKATLWHIIGQEMDEAYLSCIKALAARNDAMNKYTDSVHIVYSPLHGTGGEITAQVLKDTGFRSLHIVESQFQPNGDFPTLKTTLNPEDAEVFEQALKLAGEKDADLILATDPDCDRVGVMLRQAKKRYVFLTGNEAGALMLEYLLETKQYPDNSFVAKTIVTTQMADKIAQHYGFSIEEVLTGFKYIGQLIGKLHDTGEKTFIFGLEDSCGYLLGTEIRDKDGVIGCLLMAQAAAWYKSKGMTLYQALKKLCKKYGWFAGELVTFHMDAEALQPLQESLFSDTNATAFQTLGVTAVRNYAEQIKRDIKSDELTRLSLPKTDAVFYELADGWFCIRPSGTELNKLKIYIEVCAQNSWAAKKKLSKIKSSILKELRFD